MGRYSLFVGVVLLVEPVSGARLHRSQSGGLDTTVDKCSCHNTCEVSLGDFYHCDACNVDRSCGHWKPFGAWDYCSYTPVESFESQSAAAKISYYEHKIRANPISSVTYKNTLEVLKNSWTTSVRTSFDNYLPEMPAGRFKNIHTNGAVCGIDFIVGRSSYTGLFGRGTHRGFIRLGTATAPDDTGITPGVGFKFPRSGVPSGDFVAMHNTDGGQSWNFFATNISNHISPAVGPKLLLAKKFEQATICSTHVGISNLAAYDQEGNAFTPRFPYKLFMIAKASTSLSTRTVAEYMKEFERLRVGSTLYEVWACGTPTDFETEAAHTLERNCGSPSLLGHMKISSQCTTSDYGDQHLHVRHQRIEEDWQLEPSFLKGAQAACGRSDDDWSGGSPGQCPGVYSMMNSDA